MKQYRIHEIAKKYVEYDMIEAYTELPAFPDLRVRLLQAVLEQQRPQAVHNELYSLVVSLVQLGMDTHDLIDVEIDKRSESEMRSRQLKVLGGDYFSSQFYRLLSQAGQIEMISAISAAVCEVNRMKMNLYLMMNRLKLTAEEYLNATVQLKSELFRVFNGMLRGELSACWPELLAGMSRCEVALDELARSESPARFYQSWAYWHVLQEGTEEECSMLNERKAEPAFISGLLRKYDIEAKLTAIANAAANEVRMAAEGLASDKLAQELRQMTELYAGKPAGALPR
ncbi:heptaprenyl diphosphate synthase component 1 [Paenibacillus sp. NEAU-GSW1]|uniref:heptaprenyl diphosphate synthase component 1 n=1 Tax=Paenibacillus sp. NEAU-GSW1 TaxID=2682486 RepID=UPI00139B65EA|nr:heptaprenyl diphosphate synthase [Paenibacillus sp. NEAU-GSW1]